MGSESHRSRNLLVGATCVVCLLSLVIFFRDFLDSGLNLIDGDTGDNRLIITILEHWRAVFQDRAFFTSPNFFWPQRGVLGYSESFFLLAPPYITGRAVGMDPYIAFESSLIVFKTVGFFSMLWLLRAFVRVSWSVALVGSALFTCSNVYYVSAGHGHLMTVVFVPLLVCLSCAAWRSHGQRERRMGHIYAASFGLLLALVLFTSFYIGWFAVLAGGIAIVTVLTFQLLRSRTQSSLRSLIGATARRGPIFATAALVFWVAIIPFLIVYIPVLKGTGGRSFQEDLMYTAQLIDVINIGQGNWMWGHPIEVFRVDSGRGPMVPAEVQMGWPPLTLGLVAAGLFLSLNRRSLLGNTGSEQYQRYLLPALTASFLICLALSLKVGGRSPWWLVFRLVPGGSAIRVPARFNVVLNVLVVVIACVVLNELRKRRDGFWEVAFWLTVSLVLAEQINTTSQHLIDRNSEDAILRRVHRPPSSCASFFLAYPATPERMYFANQIDAMFIARLDDVPTLNGYSGWFPPGWEFLNFDANYLANVRQWALLKKISAGLCGLDLRDGNWIPVDLTTMPYLTGSAIDFHKAGNAGLYEMKGWSGPEPDGTWALGNDSVLLLKLAKAPTSDLWLTFKAHAFAPRQRPEFKESMKVNGREVADWSITNREVIFVKRVRLPLDLVRSGLLRIEFSNHDPRSPAELGVSRDGRNLGLALEDLYLEPNASR